MISAYSLLVKNNCCSPARKKGKQLRACRSDDIFFGNGFLTFGGAPCKKL